MNTLIKSILLTAGLAIGFSASAADQLHNTKWTTYKKDGTADSILHFTEKNGVISAKVDKVLDPRSKGKTKCDICRGKFKDKELVGATVLWGLKPDPKNPNKYINGTGIEPETGITFSGKGELNGDTLKLRGYKGITLLGKTRILKRTK